jgi:phosphoglycerate dehydrogenase-like enzyme
MNIHLIQTPTTDGLKILEAELDTGIRMTFGDQIPQPSDYDVLVCGVPPRKFIEASPNLKILIVPWAGLPNATRELMRKYPKISVHNLHHNAVPTAETALALLFSAAKFIIPYDNSFRTHNWSPRFEKNPSMLLQGKTALILGYGAIGKYVARVLKAMDMRILGVKRKSDKISDGLAEIYKPDELKELLPFADVLMITLPGTPETEGMLGKDELALLPKGAVLVNVGRGPIVDADALYHALLNGPLRGAGIDVWYNYPSDAQSRTKTPPADYPFHELDNIVMSPHRGGGSEESERLRMIDLAELLNEAAKGPLVSNKVDLTAGY